MTLRQRLSDEIHEDITSLSEEIASKIGRIEENHARERLTLNKMQHAKYEALVTMYPTLPIFDAQFPKLKRLQEKPNRNAAHHPQEWDNSDEDGSDIDGVDNPIDYKIDSHY